MADKEQNNLEIQAAVIDQIAFAYHNNKEIEEQDPLIWAVANNKKIEGKNPM